MGRHSHSQRTIGSQMSEISQRDRCRAFLRNHLFAGQGDGGETNARRLESCIYNAVLRKARAERVPQTWDYPGFRDRYIQKVMSVKYNLLHPKNPRLFQRVKDGEVSFPWLAEALPYDMYPELWDPIMEQVAMKALRRESRTADKTQEGVFQCRKCKSKCTEYYQLQTRRYDVPILHSLACFRAHSSITFCSADEPMTTFVTCNNCQNRWKC